MKVVNNMSAFLSEVFNTSIEISVEIIRHS